MKASFSSRSRILVCVLLFISALTFFWQQSPTPLRWNNAPYTFAQNNARPNAVIVILVSPSRITQALVALQNIEDRFNHRLKYPIVLFMAENEIDHLSPETKAKASYITEGRVSFAATTPESWEVPSWMDKERVQASIDNIGFSLGYRSMCRFYSGFFWKHTAVASYDWLWRLDTDIQFHCDVPYDPVERLIKQNALYGFIQIGFDGTWVQPTLASNVSHFISENRQLIPKDANHHFAWRRDEGVDKALAGTAGNDEWTLACMINNFEISHRTLWESPLYTKFFEYLDRTGGFFYERWGDAPIHSFGLAMSLRKDQVVQFNDTGYQHQGWEYTCPSLPRCACVQDGHFDDSAHAWYSPDV